MNIKDTVGILAGAAMIFGGAAMWHFWNVHPLPAIVLGLIGCGLIGHIFGTNKG